ncbi:MAG: class I SAM-dependent methyltransferase [Planctomycetota bacterium]
MTLARLGYEVHGFDISPACIAVAQRLAEKYELADRVSFSVQTAENLEYASETFDIVVGTNILHHCDIAPAIGQCWRVLKRGGLALFREHMEVPIIDPLRKCRLMLWIAPRTKSFDKEITEDEHNLTSSDMKAIREVFPDISLWRFGLCDRLRTVARRYTRALQKLDYYLFKAIPPLAVFGSDVVMTLKKG